MAPGAGPGGALKSRDLTSGLLGGSALLLVTLNFANVLHFAFHIVMARMLGPAGYSALAALLAILYVLNVLSESAQTVLARYASREPDPGRLRDLLRRALRKGGQVTLVLLAVYLAAAVPLGRWLRIPYPLMALFAFSLVGVGLLPVHRGTLQGWKRFGALGTNMILEGLVKLGLGVGLVMAGAAEYGAVAGVGLALCAAFFFSFPPLRDVYRTPAVPAPAPDIYRYSLPVFVVTATVMGFYSLDVLLARAFFPDAAAGGYAVASFLGKSILLGTAPVTKAMFPISTEAAAQGRKGGRVLAATLAILAVCVAPVLAAFAWIPGALVKAAGGAGYEAAAGLVLPLGIAMTLMSFSNALLLYRLSTGGLRGYGWLPLLIPLEAAALAMARGSLAELAWTVVAMNAVFLIAAGALSLLRPRTPAPAAPRAVPG